MNEILVKIVAQLILTVLGTLLIQFLSAKFSQSPSERDGLRVYSTNRFIKKSIHFGGIALCSMFLGLTIFIALRDGLQAWGTAFFLTFTLVFAFIFFKGLQELSVTYEVENGALTVAKSGKATEYLLCNLEIIGERNDGLILRDEWNHDFLVLSYIDGYGELKDHIEKYVRRKN